MREPSDTEVIYTKPTSSGLVLEARVKNTEASKWQVTEHHKGAAASFRETERTSFDEARAYAAAQGYDVDNPRFERTSPTYRPEHRPAQVWEAPVRGREPVDETALASRTASSSERPMRRNYRHLKNRSRDTAAYWDQQKGVWMTTSPSVEGPFATIEEMEAQLRANGYDTEDVSEGMTDAEVRVLIASQGKPIRDFPWGRIFAAIGFAIYWYIRSTA